MTPKTLIALLFTVPFLLSACAQVDEGVAEDVSEAEAMVNDLPI
jgi:predicted small secreted protein